MRETMNELYHHGIKGQKWGHRRWQNEDGTYTKAGLERYFGTENGKSDNSKALDNNTEKSYNKSIDNLSIQYQSKGLSKEEADEAAYKRKELEKIVLIGIGVGAATGLTVYAAKKIGRDYIDKTIKAGTTIQTLSQDPNRINNGKAFYTAFNEGDKKKYLGLFGVDGNGFKSKITSTASNDVKIASPKKAEKVFKDLLSRDKDFRDAFDNTNIDRHADELRYKSMGVKASKSEYDSFNRWNLLWNDQDSSLLQKKFYKALTDKGYGGVLDINDAKYSGFNTKAAIVFNNKPFMNQSISKVTADQILSGKRYYKRSIAKDTLISPLVTTSVPALIGSRFLKKYDNEIKKMINNKQRIKDKEAVTNGII